jgi:hypothetical protein
MIFYSNSSDIFVVVYLILKFSDFLDIKLSFSMLVYSSIVFNRSFAISLDE